MYHFDMVLNFDKWLYKLCSVLHMENKQIDYLTKKFEHEFTNLPNISHQEIITQQIKAHKRQVLPNDHLNKLQPQTINALNNYFGSIIDLCKPQF